MREVHEQPTDFNQDTFTQAFVKDLRRLKGLVLIQSPFITVRRINDIGAAIKSCIRRGVRVCVLVQEAYEKQLKEPTEEQLAQAKARDDAREEARQLLLEMGVHVTFRPRIHEKLAVIDEHILWEGSLNILSVDKTLERMSRWESRLKVEEVTAKHKLNSCESCRTRSLSKTGQSTDAELQGIGADVANRRKMLGLSQRELSSIAGLNQSNVSHIEAGKGNATLITLIRMCRMLRCEPRIVPSFLLPAVDELIAKCLAEQ